MTDEFLLAQAQRQAHEAQMNMQWLRIEFERFKQHLHCPNCGLVLELYAHEGIWQFYCYYCHSYWWRHAFTIEPLHQGEYRAEEKTNPQTTSPAAPDRSVRSGDAETSG